MRKFILLLILMSSFTQAAASSVQAQESYKSVWEAIPCKFEKIDILYEIIAQIDSGLLQVNTLSKSDNRIEAKNQILNDCAFAMMKVADTDQAKQDLLNHRKKQRQLSAWLFHRERNLDNDINKAQEAIRNRLKDIKKEIEDEIKEKIQNNEKRFTKFFPDLDIENGIQENNRDRLHGVDEVNFDIKKLIG